MKQKGGKISHLLGKCLATGPLHIRWVVVASVLQEELVHHAPLSESDKTPQLCLAMLLVVYPLCTAQRVQLEALRGIELRYKWGSYIGPPKLYLVFAFSGTGSSMNENETQLSGKQNYQNDCV